ncbi:MAG: hypothetical protein Ct9H300mP25_13600 [Acidobacteriota bacterium]|nr:MAG: hypothetical protein Ct9H300mP25_13600 [Acidobacteriota bacterium]
MNVTKEKHLTNMRKSTSEEAIRLVSPRTLNLEQAIEFINDDKLVEVTPQTVVSGNEYWLQTSDLLRKHANLTLLGLRSVCVGGTLG